MRAAATSEKRGIFATAVMENRRICPDHFVLRLAAAGFPAAEPGQFVQVQCGSPAGDIGAEERFDASRVPVVRRPFSLAGCKLTAEGAELDILYRVVGPGTAWMAQRSPGDRVSVIGPLGRPFSIRRQAAFSLLVGGGTGLPPMMWLARLLAAQGLRAVAVCGARNQDLLPMDLGGARATAMEGVSAAYVAEFGDTPVVVTTDDGSAGLRGTVIDGVRTVRAAVSGEASRTAIYACGPEGMLRAISALAESEGIACQVCMERMMACGMGTCQSCVVRTKDPAGPRGWRYQLCCADGPVFDSRAILW